MVAGFHYGQAQDCWEHGLGNEITAYTASRSPQSKALAWPHELVLRLLVKLRLEVYIPRQFNN